MKNLKPHDDHDISAFMAFLPQLVFLASVGIVLAISAVLKARHDEDQHEFSHIHFVDNKGKWLGKNAGRQVEHALKCDGKYVVVRGELPTTNRVKKVTNTKRIKSIKPEVIHA